MDSQTNHRRFTEEDYKKAAMEFLENGYYFGPLADTMVSALSNTWTVHDEYVVKPDDPSTIETEELLVLVHSQVPPHYDAAERRSIKK